MRRTKLLAIPAISLLAVGWVVPVSASAAEAGSSHDVNASIVWVDVAFPAAVEVPWEDGSSTVYTTEVLTLCTGFFVSDDGEIATAGHCVEADATTEASAITHVVQDLEYEGYDISGLDLTTLDWPVKVGDPTAYVGQPSGVSDGVFSGKGSMTAQIVDYQAFAAGDNALLRVADLDDTPGLPLAEDKPSVGDQVTSVGFPGSVAAVSDPLRQLPSYKFGTVSSRQYTDKGVPNTEIDAAVSEGMSGGPTLNEDGQVIGINSFGIRGESQPFNFVTDTETLSDFLRRNGVDPAATPVGTGAPVGFPTTPQDAPEPAPPDTSTQTSGAPAGDEADTTAAAPVALPATVEVPETGGLPVLVWGAGAIFCLLLLLGGALAGRHQAQQRRAP